MKTVTLVEGIHINLHPDPNCQAPMETNAYVGQRFKLNGRLVEIVSNTGLSWTIRYVTLFERIKEYLNAKIRRNVWTSRCSWAVKRKT